MVLIASSLGLALYTLAGLQPMQAALVALATLTILILYNVAAMRLRDRTDVGGQIADLSRGTADLARQVAEFGRRLHAVEGKIAGASGNMERRVDPLREEISELGNLVKQLAVSVAAHEELLNPDEPADEVPPPPRQSSRRQAASRPSRRRRSSPTRSSGPLLRPAPRRGQVAEPKPPHRRKPAAPVDDPRIVAAVKDAVDDNRIDLHLQPMVTLPQRKVRFYEAMSRIRDRDDNVIRRGRVHRHRREDTARWRGSTRRCCCAACRCCAGCSCATRTSACSATCPASTLRDTDVFGRCLDFLDANRALAPSFVLEIKQSTLRSLGPRKAKHLAALAQRGFRFSIDNVTDLRLRAARTCRPQRAVRQGAGGAAARSDARVGYPSVRSLRHARPVRHRPRRRADRGRARGGRPARLRRALRPGLPVLAAAAAAHRYAAAAGRGCRSRSSLLSRDSACTGPAAARAQGLAALARRSAT